jgi:hypothetical protein
VRGGGPTAVSPGFEPRGIKIQRSLSFVAQASFAKVRGKTQPTEKTA